MFLKKKQNKKQNKKTKKKTKKKQKKQTKKKTKHGQTIQFQTDAFNQKKRRVFHLKNPPFSHKYGNKVQSTIKHFENKKASTAERIPYT